MNVNKTKKRILITQSAMFLGGAERALLAMLEAIDYSRYEVDLFLYRHEGELLHLIPQEVNLLPEIREYKLLMSGMRKAIKSPKLALALIVARFRAWLYRPSKVDDYCIYDEIDRCAAHILPSIQNDVIYDACISYLANHHIERNKVKAHRYIAWIHTDYSTISIHKGRNYAGWALFDDIVSISSSVSEGFAAIFPDLREKLVLVENGVSSQMLKHESERHDVMKEMRTAISLLSIGRFSPQKNFPNAVEIMAELCKLRDDVVWYIIGYGTDEPKIRAAIERFGMQDKFIILGKKTNPYPYIKSCNLYVQPSLYEGKCIAVLEAQALGKPVAITNYPMAQGQLEDGVDGVIIPMEAAAAAKALHELLSDSERMQRLAETCSQRDYGCDLTNLYQIFE